METFMRININSEDIIEESLALCNNQPDNPSPTKMIITLINQAHTLGCKKHEETGSEQLHG